MERFTGTAVLDEAHARDLGVVGVAGRASGLAFDARIAHPFDRLGRGFSPRSRRAETSWPASTSGSTKCGRRCTPGRPHRARRCSRGWSPGSRTAVGWQHRREGWVSPKAGGGLSCIGWSSTTEGRLVRVKVVDPSFLNWPALPVSLADTIVPDFPLANKSFNLSYAGNDL